MSERYRLFFLACLADDAQMYDDLASLMKSLARTGAQLSNPEFSLLGRSMHIVTNKLRFSWKAVKDKIRFYEENNAYGVNDQHLRTAKRYLQEIEDEMIETCFDNVEILDRFVLANAASCDIMVLSLRGIADNYRYLSFIAEGDEKVALSNRAHDFYREAIDQSIVSLAPSNPARLRVFLNYSLFLYKILHQRTTAIEVIKRAFTEALNDFPHVEHPNLQEVVSIMQALRSNLDIWTRRLPTRNGYHHEDVGQGDGIHVG